MRHPLLQLAIDAVAAPAHDADGQPIALHPGQTTIYNEASMQNHTNASTDHTTAHIDQHGTKHYGVQARFVADREASDALCADHGTATHRDGIGGPHCDRCHRPTEPR